MQKHGLMANNEINVSKPCLVCGDVEPRFSWTDLHGEGYCLTCGTPYDLKSDERKCKIMEKWIPILQEHWNETHRGNGLGTFLIWRDYPDQKENCESFQDWVREKHPELLTHPQ